MKKTIVFLMICAAVMGIAGCGGGDGGGGTLSVSSVTPTASATDQAVTTTVTATFNQAVDSALLTTSTFTLTGNGIAVGGTVAYNATTYTATFTPTFPLRNLLTYTATLTTGTGLASNHTWQFTTVTRKMVYESQRNPDGTDTANPPNNTANIWTMNTDGTGAAALAAITAAGAGSFLPVWSPDGTKIAFESQRALDGSDAATGGGPNLWVMNADGSSPTALTSFTGVNAWSGTPQWSPGGTQIAFCSGSDWASGTLNVWVVNPDGTGATTLTSLAGAGMQCMLPQWSPDGTKIVYVSNRAADGSDAVSPNNIWNIWVINTDGTGSAALTSLTNLPAWSLNWGPQWSPDGTKIVFTSPRKLDGTDAVNDNSTANVWVMNADGSSPTALTSLTADNADCRTPRWSPDGTKIAYESMRALDGSDAATAGPTYNIWVMNADGSSQAARTSQTVVDADSDNPQWSPDGTKIAYESQRALDGSNAANTNTTFNVWSMNADGTGATPLTSLTAAGALSWNMVW